MDGSRARLGAKPQPYMFVARGLECGWGPGPISTSGGPEAMLSRLGVRAG